MSARNHLSGLCALLALSASAPSREIAAPARETARGGALYAVLPLRNLSSDTAAPAELIERVRARLARRGAEFVPVERLDALLRERRIRYTDSLAREDAAAIGAATGARWVLAGVLLDFARGREPRVALGLRVLDAETGERVSSILVALRGEDFEGLLGLGAVDDPAVLSEHAAARVLEAFAGDGVPRLRPADGGKRIAVLPFENRSTRPEAGTSFAEILAHQWFEETGAQVVEASELRRALVSARVRSMADVDAPTMARIAERLGVRWFALGSVERFGEETPVRERLLHEIEASVRLVDARTGLLVASHHVRRRGDADESLLGIGIVGDAIVLASQAAHELVEGATRSLAARERRNTYGGGP